MLWSVSSLGNMIITENIFCCGFKVQISLEIIFMKNKNDMYIVFPVWEKKIHKERISQMDHQCLSYSSLI